MLIPDLRQRFREPEKMDDPCSDTRKLENTLDQFASINRLFSRVRAPLKAHLFPLLSAERDFHLVDLGAGACDIPLWLLSEARKHHLKLRITAVDRDPRVVNYARSRFQQVPNLVIQERDAFDLGPLGPVDYIFGNHFLHHLQDGTIRDLLTVVHHTCRRGYLFSDLRRSQFSYQAFRVVSRMYRNSFTREDGLVSIRKGFQPEELRAFAPQPACRIFQCFPGRIFLQSPPDFQRDHSDPDLRGLSDL